MEIILFAAHFLQRYVSSDLADLQSDLGDSRNPLQRQIPPALQRRKKRSCVSADNLTELDAKSAKELVAGRKKRHHGGF